MDRFKALSMSIKAKPSIGGLQKTHKNHDYHDSDSIELYNLKLIIF